MNEIPISQTVKPAFSKGALQVSLAALLFACKGTFIKLTYAHGATVDVVMVLRMLIAMPFYLWVGLRLWKAEAHVLNVHEWLQAAGVGICGYYVASYFDLLGLRTVSAGLERVILYTYPVFVILLSALLLKQVVSRALCLRIGLIYTGLLLVFYGDIRLQGGVALLDIVHGSLWVLASAIVFSLYVVGSEHFMRRISSALFTAVSMSAAGVMMLGHYLLVDSPSALLGLADEVYGLSALTALVFTVLPSFMMASGVRAIGAARASAVGMVGPLATVLVAAVFLQEWPGVWQIAGLAVVIAGMYRVTRL